MKSERGCFSRHWSGAGGAAQAAPPQGHRVGNQGDEEYPSKRSDLVLITAAADSCRRAYDGERTESRPGQPAVVENRQRRRLSGQ